MPLVTSEQLEKMFLPTSESLPESEKEWVVMDVSPLRGGDLESVTSFDDDNVLKFYGQIVSGRIREWNVTDNGVVADITPDNVKRLPFEDLAHLYSKITGKGESALPKAPSVSSTNI
jgi:hypothetical protein